MGKTKLVKNNYALPGEPMAAAEFEDMIRKAEKGPFHTVAHVKSELAKWKAKYLK